MQNMPFKSFWREISNKKHLSMWSLSLDKFKFSVKVLYTFLDYNILYLRLLATLGIFIFCCVMCWNWGSKQFNLKFFKSSTIYHVSKIKGMVAMDLIWPNSWPYITICICLCSYLCTYLVMHFRFSTLTLYLILKEQSS